MAEAPKTDKEKPTSAVATQAASQLPANLSVPVGKPATLKALLDKAKVGWGDVAKKYMTPDRLYRISLIAFSRNPKLYQCTGQSVLGALMDAARWELEPGGTDGDGYLVPFENRKAGVLEAVFIPGYQGLCKVLVRGGGVEDIMPHAVYEKDDFELFYDASGPNFRHRPYGTKPTETGDAGKLFGVYSLALLPNGRSSVHFMTVAQIDAHKKKFSKSWKNADSAWQTSELPMQMKTVIRGHYKFLPKASAQVQEVVERIASHEDVEIDLDALNAASGQGRIESGAGAGDGGGDGGAPGNGSAPATQGADAGGQAQQPGDDDGGGLGDQTPAVEDRTINLDEQTKLAALMQATGKTKAQVWPLAKKAQPEATNWRELKLATYLKLVEQLTPSE
jgi:recombination protein RecT